MSRAKQRKMSGALWAVWIVIAAAAVFCELSLFGLCGGLGERIRSFLFGAFGLVGYVFPVLTAVWFLYLFMNRRRPAAIFKCIAAILFVWVLCALLQHIMMDYSATMTYAAEFDRCAAAAAGGGAAGAFIVHFMRPALGAVGLAFVLIILLILLEELMSGFALINMLRCSGKRSEAAHAKERRQRRRDSSESAKQQTGYAKRPKKKSRSSGQPQYYDVKDTDSSNVTNHRHEGSDDQDSVFATIGADKKRVGRQRSKTNGTTLSKSPELVELSGQDQKKKNDGSSIVFHTLGDTEKDGKKESSKKTPSAKKPSSKPKKNMAKEQDSADLVIPDTSAAETAAYTFPPYNLLPKGSRMTGDSKTFLRETALKLEETLRNFGVNVTVTDVSCGPAVTRYELQPEAGVKVSRIVALENDIKLNLAASDIRIEAPIPGKAAVGIEVPNKTNSMVMLRDLLEDDSFRNQKSRIVFPAGRDIAGKPVIADIQKMPHVLIAGATGSGKSVCINTIIISILYNARPDEVRLIMIDPKVVELSVYNNIPHLLIPVVTDPKKAAGALNWAVAEMTRRYRLFAENSVRKIEEYNAKIRREASKAKPEDGEVPRPLPQIVIIVDELADLMMVASKEVEDAIVRLTQLARAAGIHLVIATQRPSVNVITGLIKANMPSRIAFAVTSGIDSRTILDMNGAEKLLGHGDMLFFPAGYPKPVRVQGAFVDAPEVSSVVNYVISHNEDTAGYDHEVVEGVEASTSAAPVSIGADPSADEGDDRDEYFYEAGRFIIEKEKASIGMLQRRFKIGFNRAARIMDQLCEAGVVGEEEGTKPRKVLMTSVEEFEQGGED